MRRCVSRSLAMTEADTSGFVMGEGGEGPGFPRGGARSTGPRLDTAGACPLQDQVSDSTARTESLSGPEGPQRARAHDEHVRPARAQIAARRRRAGRRQGVVVQEVQLARSIEQVEALVRADPDAPGAHQPEPAEALVLAEVEGI